ncbi:MAG: hypothetical protein ACYS14_03530 [Planctomycetota bacterium]
MSKRTRDTRNSTDARGSNWRFWFLVGMVPAAVIGLLIWRAFSGESVAERLAAFEAARAIPDSENAAIIYGRLLDNPDADYGSLVSPDPESDEWTRRWPWFERDHPELADWIRECQWLIDELLVATQLEKCHFRIDIEPYRPPVAPAPVSRVRTMRRWLFLLKQAANNDVAEGRIDDAISKWRCMIKLGRHLQQQFRLIELLEGIGLETSGATHASAYVVEGDPDEHQLHKIVSLPFETRDDWDAILGRIAPVEELALQEYKKDLGLVDRLKYEFGIGAIGSTKGRVYPIAIARKNYLKALASRRGLHILIALRRYRNEYHRWPKSLDEIRSRVPAEILVDPINDGDFVYRLTNNGFTLYSKGENKVDEGGKYKSRSEEGPDDRRIWPPIGRKTKSEAANK